MVDTHLYKLRPPFVRQAGGQAVHAHLLLRAVPGCFGCDRLVRTVYRSRCRVLCPWTTSRFGREDRRTGYAAWSVDCRCLNIVLIALSTLGWRSLRVVAAAYPIYGGFVDVAVACARSLEM